MTQTLSSNTIFNSFAVFREILQGISGFTSIFPKAEFTTNTRYFQDEPRPKSRSFPGYPLIMIDTDMDDERLSYLRAKQMNYTTVISIYTDYDIEHDTPRLNSYINAIVDYMNENQTTLLRTYGIDGIKVRIARDRDEIAEKQLIVGMITVDYVVRMDVE